jgi:uncharacterized protein
MIIAKGSWIGIAAVVLFAALFARLPQSIGADDGDKAAKPIPEKSVQLNDGFLKQRFEVVRAVTIPAAHKWCESTGRIANFERAAAPNAGDENRDRKLPANPYDDADVYRTIEAAAYCLAAASDRELEAKIDGWIDKIAAAQEKDGYLYTARTIDPEHPHRLTGDERWVNETADSYELSNLGYLFQAAVAHHQATGKSSLLDVAKKSADLLEKTFGPDKKKIVPGHSTVEAGLLQMYETTGEKRYLNLTRFLIDQRSVEQLNVSGNALDALNLYCGITEAASLSQDAAYRSTIERLWTNIVGRRLLVTGGIGTAGDGTFGRNSFVPNTNPGSFTSASVANVEWNARMMQLTGEGKYVDVLERTLYNALPASISLDGKRVFDANPLESLGRNERRDWTASSDSSVRPRQANARLPGGNAPLDLARLIAALPGYIYAASDADIYVNLYAASTAEIKLAGELNVKIKQETQYPWDENVRLTVSPGTSADFAVKLRIPGWARNEVFASDSYTFADRHDEPAVLRVNGDSMPVEASRGYATIRRRWNAGDTIELALPMPIRRVAANPQIVDDRDHVALQRGPIVYCLESNGDLPKVRNLVLKGDVALEGKVEPDLHGGITAIRGKASAIRLNEQDELQEAPQEIVAIPYFAWANRGPAEMVVWIPTTAAGAVPIAAPNLAAKAKITCSSKQPTRTSTNAQAVDGRAAKDGIEPRSSHDNGPLSHFDWWPDRNVTEWCEYSWDQPVTIQKTQLYWWDDSTIGGGCKAPVSWKAFYKSGDEWKPVETSGSFGVAKDQYNSVKFQPVTTTALRLEIVVPTDASVGIQEWKVR